MIDTVIFIIVVLLLILAVKGSVRHFKGEGSCCSSSSGSSSEHKKLADVIETKDFIIDGMHCGACASRVEKALNGISGVAVTSIDWKSGKTQLAFSRKISGQLLEKVVRDAGCSLRS